MDTPPSLDQLVEKIDSLSRAAGVSTKEPVIARTPVYGHPTRDATSFDRQSIGPGIFQFRDSKVMSEQQKDDATTGEAPLPRPFSLSIPRKYLSSFK